MLNNLSKQIIASSFRYNSNKATPIFIVYFTYLFYLKHIYYLDYQLIYYLTKLLHQHIYHIFLFNPLN